MTGEREQSHGPYVHACKQKKENRPQKRGKRCFMQTLDSEIQKARNNFALLLDKCSRAKKTAGALRPWNGVIAVPYD
jgi:hypothetical protein